MQIIKVEATKRAQIGSRSAKDARTAGLIPCVMYGRNDLIHFTAEPKALKALIYTPDFKVVEFTIDGDMHKAILKDIQVHPVTDAVLHVDFIKLTDGIPVKVEIPLRTKGLSEGVKVGGKLIQQVRNIKVKVNPENLVNELFVDISHLQLGQSVRVRDIQSSAGIQIMNPPATPVALIEIPRALRSAAAAAKEVKGGKKK